MNNSHIFIIEQIEPPYQTEISSLDDEYRSIDPSYAMDYITDIMNLLYTLEKKYPIQSSFLINSSSLIIDLSTRHTWKLTSKHRTIVIGWIIQLFYGRFHLSQDALHM